MQAYTRRATILLAVLTLGAATSSPRVLAQGRSERPVFLAIPETFPDLDARVVLMREPGRDIVLFRDSDATPEALRVALALLRRLDRDEPLRSDRMQIVPVTGFAGGRELEPERRAALQAALDELRDAPTANVGNLGWGRWMRFRDE